MMQLTLVDEQDNFFGHEQEGSSEEYILLR